MNCKKCGLPLTENDLFCKNCGASVNAQNEQENIQQPVNNQVGVVQQPVYNQPMQNVGQPALANSNNYTPANQQPKGNGSVKYIVIGVVVVVAIFAAVILAGMFSKKDSTNSSGNSSSESSVAETLSNKSYKVNFKEFTFSIPDNLVYEKYDEALLIGDEEYTWIARFELEQGSYAQLKSYMGQFQAMLEQSGYTSTPAAEKTLGGLEFITMEVIDSGQQNILAYSKVNSMYYVELTIKNIDNDIDYSILETMAPIINTAEFNSSTNNMSTSNEIDTSGIAELAK